jgi:predicted transcriptional regulator
MVKLFGRTGPVIWDATISNVKNTNYQVIDKGTEAYEMAKKASNLILLDENNPIGALEFAQISKNDLVSNKTVSEIKYSPVDVKDGQTKVGDAYEDLEKGKVILVKGKDDKIDGVLTMSDYAKKRFTK